LRASAAEVAATDCTADDAGGKTHKERPTGQIRNALVVLCGCSCCDSCEARNGEAV